jgi:hypothetical protein
MGGNTSTRLSILAKLSNLSTKYGRLNGKKQARAKWLEVKKEIQTLCGGIEKDDAELMLKLAERDIAARRSGLAEIPMPSDMTVIRKRK